jgi:hypothetical protein
VNVDLLIRDQQLGTLLAWRQDERLWSGLAHPRAASSAIRNVRFAHPAPGTSGIGSGRRIRSGAHRDGTGDRAVAAKTRSFRIRCRLLGPPSGQLRQAQAEPRHGQWAWHREFPVNLIPEPAGYRRFF